MGIAELIGTILAAWCVMTFILGGLFGVGMIIFAIVKGSEAKMRINRAEAEAKRAELREKIKTNIKAAEASEAGARALIAKYNLELVELREQFAIAQAGGDKALACVLLRKIVRAKNDIRLLEEALAKGEVKKAQVRALIGELNK